MDASSPRATARSDDGRSFHIAGPVDGFVVGALVVVDDGERRQLALVEHRDEERGSLRGRLIGLIGDDLLDARATAPFASASVSAVDAASVDLLHAATGAALEIGTDLTPPGGPARLLPHRFNRHTFWCGQSGSGKTYALGVVLSR
jgi:hypothetical protein